MITVHHLDNSRSQRILWLLEELGLDYQITNYKRDADMQAPDSLRRVHPLGKSPVITDGEHTVAESGAIMDYLLETYGQGRLMPQVGTPEWRRFRYWLHYAEGSAMPPQLLHLVFEQLPKKAPRLVRPLVRAISAQVGTGYIQPQLKLHADFWEAELAARPWFAGDEFTAADIQMSFPIETSSVRVGFVRDYPKCKLFLEKIQHRPSYRRALERGGNYVYAH